MRIAVMGSGGVGGYFGGRLAYTGEDVTFIARGAHLAAIRERGLMIESDLESIHVPDVQATDDPAQLDPVDLVIFAVKLVDTEEAAKSVRSLVGPDTAIVSFQNGIKKDEILHDFFGPSAVMGGVAYIATGLKKPGVIKHTGTMQRMRFGEYDGSRSPRAKAFFEACKRAGIEAVLSDNIRRDIWEKFVFLVGLSATTTAIRRPIGPIREDPQARTLLREVMEEVVAVGRAQGVDLPEDFAGERLEFCDTLPADMTSSMHHDLDQGKPLELPWLSGNVVELGAAAGVPTPANQAICGVLGIHARGLLEA